MQCYFQCQTLSYVSSNGKICYKIGSHYEVNKTFAKFTAVAAQPLSKNLQSDSKLVIEDAVNSRAIMHQQPSSSSTNLQQCKSIARPLKDSDNQDRPMAQTVVMLSMTPLITL